MFFLFSNALRFPHSNVPHHFHEEKQDIIDITTYHPTGTKLSRSDRRHRIRIITVGRGQQGRSSVASILLMELEQKPAAAGAGGLERKKPKYYWVLLNWVYLQSHCVNRWLLILYAPQQHLFEEDVRVRLFYFVIRKGNNNKWKGFFSSYIHRYVHKSSMVLLVFLFSEGKIKRKRKNFHTIYLTLTLLQNKMLYIISLFIEFLCVNVFTTFIVFFLLKMIPSGITEY